MDEYTNIRLVTALKILRRHAVLIAKPGEEFTLKSGAKSSYYIDVRRVALMNSGLTALVNALSDRMYELHLEPKLIAGVVLGGCPLATGMSISNMYDSIYVRPKAKEHGTGELIEGIYEPGEKVLLLEDVVTSGISTLKAIDSLREVDLDVIGVLAILDREQGGGPLISRECAYSALFTLKELLSDMVVK